VRTLGSGAGSAACQTGRRSCLRVCDAAPQILFRAEEQNGDAALYDKLMAKMQANGTSLENYYLYFQTLSKFRDPKLLERTLEFAISPSVRSQDTLGMIAAVMRNPAGGNLAWDFVRAHWADIDKVGGGFTSAEVVGATNAYCETSMHDQVQDFFFACSQQPNPGRTVVVGYGFPGINRCFAF